MTFNDFMQRYTLGLFGVIKGYCDWVESEAKTDKDSLFLLLGPLLLLGLVLWGLPAWLGKTIALVLLAPVLYLAYLGFRGLFK